MVRMHLNIEIHERGFETELRRQASGAKVSILKMRTILHLRFAQHGHIAEINSLGAQRELADDKIPVMIRARSFRKQRRQLRCALRRQR